MYLQTTRVACLVSRATAARPYITLSAMSAATDCEIASALVIISSCDLHLSYSPISLFAEAGSLLLGSKPAATADPSVQNGEVGNTIVRSLWPWIDAVAEQFGWEIADYYGNLRRWEILQFRSNYTAGENLPTVQPLSEFEDDLTATWERDEFEDDLTAIWGRDELKVFMEKNGLAREYLRIRATMETEELRKEWFRFRSRIESMDASVSRLESYREQFWSEDITPDHAFRDSGWDRISRKWARKLNEARSLERQVRDYLQIHVGQLSLEESKKSIEVSEVALAKNRQVKLGMIPPTITGDDLQNLLLTARFACLVNVVTILAFVFLPISLTTGVFGMNVQVWIVISSHAE